MPKVTVKGKKTMHFPYTKKGRKAATKMKRKMLDRK